MIAITCDHTHEHREWDLSVHFVASRIFKPIWAMLRPWLDPVTRTKFHVLGSDYQAALKAISTCTPGGFFAVSPVPALSFSVYARYSLELSQKQK